MTSTAKAWKTRGSCSTKGGGNGRALVEGIVDMKSDMFLLCQTA